jgi:hypothetical protein
MASSQGQLRPPDALSELIVHAEFPAQSESTSTPAQSTEPVMLGGQTVQVFGAVNKAAPLPGTLRAWWERLTQTRLDRLAGSAAGAIDS